MSSRWITLSVVGAMVLLSAGCGDEEAGGGATVKVSETEYALSPANPSVEKTGVVELEVSNDGKVGHALEVEGPDGEVETETIEPGGEATLKADLSKPGRYKWYCPIGDHEQRGMKGEIMVAGGGGEPSDEEKQGGSDGHGGYSY